MAGNYMDLFIEAIIAIALFAPLQSYVDSANASGAAGLLLALVPILYIIVLVAAFAFAVKGRMSRK